MKRKKTILVVDDEEAIAESMQDLLTDKGFDVQIALNGVSGLKILAEESIDLIVLDLNMPRMDGYMFMEHLRDRWEKEGRAFPMPKIIILTAVDKKTDLGLAKSLGASEFINKPYKNEDLVSLVKNLTE